MKVGLLELGSLEPAEVLTLLSFMVQRHRVATAIQIVVCNRSKCYALMLTEPVRKY